MHKETFGYRVADQIYLFTPCLGHKITNTIAFNSLRWHVLLKKQFQISHNIGKFTLFYLRKYFFK